MTSFPLKVTSRRNAASHTSTRNKGRDLSNKLLTPLNLNQPDAGECDWSVMKGARDTNVAPLGGVKGRLCDHVLLSLVESDLAERHGAHRHVDGGGDEAVDADLVVEAVDVLRGVFTAGDNTRSLVFHSCHTESQTGLQRRMTL